VVGRVKREIREEFGIRNEVKVVAGATDSTTSFFSSGARDVGDWNTNVGTVLGIRGVAERFIRDPDGLLYTHRHPEGYWLPGAASNTGGEAVRLFFKNDLKTLDRKIETLPPTGSLIYPLARKSEKFPFLNLDAAGFVIMEGCDPVLMFKGFLEGVAYVERMIYEKIASIGYKVGGKVFSMGGGAYSLPWMRIRASVLRRSVCRAKEVETAFGAAVIAASGVHYKSLTEAIARMVSMETSVEPDEKNARVYDDLHARFVEECKKRKFF
jgi:sugar (pentulose or hexulose) kinase